MENNIKTTSTSKQSATGEDIILRQTTTTRFIFRPEIVDNPNNKEASVRGNFIFQKKKPSGDWLDYRDFDLARLKDNEWIKLELKSGELLKLVKELEKYYQVYETHGVVSGETDFIVTPRNAKNIILKFLENPKNFQKLEELKIEDLQKLSQISSINTLKSVLQIWNEHKTNPNEEFWQTFLTKNAWLIPQLFAQPVVLFRDKGYVGGKSIDNTGGKLVDFAFQNCLTQSLLIVEIKTPVTKILGSKYRESAYCCSSELSGAISQVLNYKDEIQKEFYSLARKSARPFEVFNPKCMVIAGTINDQWDSEQVKSFELIRNDSKSIEVITFDELFKRAEMLIGLLES